MSLRISVPRHLLRRTAPDSENTDITSPTTNRSTPNPVDGTDIALSRLFLAGNFLTNLCSLIIQSMKWTLGETPISMMARSGSEFPTMPLLIRTAVITAVLVIRADLDVAETHRQQEIEDNHAAFV